MADADKKKSQEEINKELFSKYLSNCVVMIVDRSSSSRIRLSQMINSLGAELKSIHQFSSFEEAKQAMPVIKPKLILADYFLGKFSGFDLLEPFRLNEDKKKSSHIFALVTSNSSQAAVARAAEEDVDTFILKPYSVQNFEENLIRAAIAKLFPSDYIKVIDAGKEFLFNGEPEKAMQFFDRAITMSEKPTLAYFYKGQAESLKQAIDSAAGSYQKGLGYDNIHYKCLVGLFDVFMGQQKHTDAYEVVKRISRYFPANPKRLASVVWLAMVTKSYDDIEKYYENFIALDARNEEIVKYICSALFACGKYYIEQRKENERGLALFQKASYVVSGRTRILRMIVEILIENKMATGSREFLTRFPVETHKEVDYLISQFMVEDTGLSVTASINKSRNLIKEGVHHPFIYESLIRKSIEARQLDSAEDVLLKALKRFPQQSLVFKALEEKLNSTREDVRKAKEALAKNVKSDKKESRVA